MDLINKILVGLFVWLKIFPQHRLAGQLFDRGEENVVLQWMPSWLRLVVAVAAGAFPLVFFVRGLMRGDADRRAQTWVLLVLRLPIICLVSLIGVVSLLSSVRGIFHLPFVAV